MSAGNTYEEAIVQGLCEIFERYAIKEILRKKIKIPEIPAQYYLKYEKIKKLIEYYEKIGFKIKVKDASLKKNIPVVCIQMEDFDNNTIILSFGSHLCLPVAIERALTEIIQCRDFDIMKKTLFTYDRRYYSEKYFEYLLKDDINQLITALTGKKLVFEKNKFLEELFETDTPDYNFSKEVWINPTGIQNNKQLLKLLLNKTQKLTKYDIYIRDSSFLGFPCVYIYIPKISNTCPLNRKKINDLKNVAKINIKIKNSKFDFNIKDLLKAVEFITKNRFNFINKLTYRLPEEYIGLLCAIVLKDKKRIINFINIILSHKFLYGKFNKDTITLFKIIIDYYEDENSLNKKYTKTDINRFKLFINNLDYNVIIRILQNENKLEGLDELYFLLEKDNIKLQEIFTPVFEKNIPNQMNFNKIFKDITGKDN